MNTRIAFWLIVSVACGVWIWSVQRYVAEVDESAVKFQMLDHFNSKR